MVVLALESLLARANAKSLSIQTEWKLSAGTSRRRGHVDGRASLVFDVDAALQGLGSFLKLRVDVAPVARMSNGRPFIGDEQASR